jgi:hypothetical protein
MPINLTGSSIASTYDQLLHVDGGPEATEKTVYSGVGVATAMKVGTQSASVDNIKFDGNTISTLDTNGNLILAPDGTGSVSISKVAVTGGTISGISDLAVADGGTGASTASDARTNLGLGTIATQNSNNISITGGAISGVTFSGSFTGLTLVESTTLTGTTTTNGGNLRLNANTLSSTNTNGNIVLAPNGTGQVLSSSPLGYNTGTGGTVTQATSRTTGVTLDKITGEIVLFAASISGHEADEFTLTNSTIAANDVVVVCIKNGCAAGTRKYYQTQVVSVSAGSCVISVANIDNHTIPSTGTDTPVLQFAVIKSAVA